MSILDVFSLKKRKDKFNSEVNKTLSAITPSTIPTTSEAIRVNPEALERIYRRDPVIFNGINLYTKSILSTEFKFDASDDEIIRFMNSWAREVDLREVIMKSVTDMAIFGNSWNELIFDANGNVVRIDYLDPKLMDFQRNVMHMITFEKNTKEPAGYVQYLPMMAPHQPNEVTQVSVFGPYSRAIKVDKEKISHSALYTAGRDLLGIGLIESQYDDSSNKRVIEKGAGQYIFRLGYPIITAYVGNKDQMPYPDINAIKAINKKITNLNERATIAVPHYVKLEMLESKGGEKYQSYIDHFISQQITGMGAPISLVTGSGQETNRSTLQGQMLMFERTLKFFEYKLSTALEDQVFSKIALAQNWDEAPRLVWEELSLESMESKAKRITDYVKAGVITPGEDIEKFVRMAEGLPPLKK